MSFGFYIESLCKLLDLQLKASCCLLSDVMLHDASKIRKCRLQLQQSLLSSSDRQIACTHAKLFRLV